MKKSVFLLFFVVLGFLSCKKEVENIVKEGYGDYIPNFKFEDDMLVFKDSIEFEKAIQYFKSNYTINGESNFINKPEGFESMLDVYYKADGIEDEKLYIEYCTSHPEVFCKVGSDTSYFYELKIPHLLALLANSKGMMKIGDSYVLYSNNYVYKSKNINSLNAIIEAGYSIIPSDVFFKETNSNIGNVDEKSEYSYKTAYFDNKHRIVGRLYKYQSGNYYYEGFTTAQKKGAFGIWTKETISSVNFARGTGYATDYPNHFYYVDINPSSVTFYNNSEVGNYIVILFGGYADNAQSYCPVSHSGTRSGVNASIYSYDAF